MKITKSNNVSDRHTKGLWKVSLNGDPSMAVRDCFLETKEGLQITSLGPVTPLSLADAQWICLLNNKATSIVKLHDSLVKYFEGVRKALKDKPEHTETLDRVEKILSTLKDIYG